MLTFIKNKVNAKTGMIDCTDPKYFLENEALFVQRYSLESMGIAIIMVKDVLKILEQKIFLYWKGEDMDRIDAGIIRCLTEELTKV